jgi:hypothetical protein
MIISLSVQTAVCCSRGTGTEGVSIGIGVAVPPAVAVQLSAPGSYLPPVLVSGGGLPPGSRPPQTII